ncbi:MAG TPA: hypothetical protein P5120_12880 [Spirochaetota bacterium]|nr:hypothetical protein [Spirochaetota bacterium]HRX48406.1 hypothetical protein [Spirochaetota bacterium]
MDYKKEMKKLMKRREAYYPAFEYLLDIYNRRGEFRFPVSIDSAEQVALVLELIDIGYLDKDAFIIKKTRNNVDALYYNGGYPLTEQGLLMERAHLHIRRGRYVKLVLFLSLAGLVLFIYFMIF